MVPWEQVLDEVVRNRRAALVGYACLFAPPSEAEDLVQEALVRTFARKRTFEDVYAADVKKSLEAGEGYPAGAEPGTGLVLGEKPRPRFLRYRL